jgi:hypothetical protein
VLPRSLVGKVDKDSLAVTQRRHPDECPNRFDVPPGLAYEAANVAIGQLYLDRHGPRAALE